METLHGWIALLCFVLLSSRVSMITSECQPCKPQNGDELADCKCNEVGEITIILLHNNDYRLKKNVTLKGSSSVTIIGNDATIVCPRQAAVILQNKTMVNISDVTISGCGASVMKIEESVAAIAIINSSKASINRISVSNSFGTGLYLKDCGGNITITNSEFESNTLGGDWLRYGGGGVHIEQMQQQNYAITIAISHCNFTSNNASIGEFKLERFPVERSNRAYLLFGRGGGLSVYLQTSCVHVIVSECKFYNNTAHRGGGLFVAFLKKSFDNLINITNSIFKKNQCTTQELPESIYSSGGALAAIYDSNSTHNKINVSHCHFKENVAYYGGGLSMGTARNGESSGGYGNDFTIENSTFEKNNAQIGSAMDLFCYSFTGSSNCRCVVTPTIRNIEVTNNGALYNYTDHESGRTISTLHFQSLTAKFEGNVTVAGNQATGVGLENSVMEICVNANVFLCNNSGRIGGGVAAFGESQLYLHNFTELSLKGNMASQRGGGMYIEQSDLFFSIYSYSCFMRSENNLEPDNWKTKVSFSQNMANGKPNAIFTSSVYPCVWPKNGTLSQDIFATFCEWKSFEFLYPDGKECTDLIQTLPNNFTMTKYSVTVYPYIRERIEGFGVLDDFGHNVTENSLFTTCLLSADSNMNASTLEPNLNSMGLLMNNEVQGNYKLLVQTAYHRSVSSVVEVEVLPCPAGYAIQKNREHKECTCNVSGHALATLGCNQSTLELTVFIGHCAGISDKNQLVYSKCPFTANYFHPTTPANYSPQDFNNNFCEQHNRKGFLCQKCINETYGVDIFSPVYKCIQCNSTSQYANWLKAVSVIIVPQTIFFVVVVIFHVGITAPTMTGYIFFSHVLALPLETLIIQSAWSLDLSHTKSEHAPHILTDVLLDPYRIWNFDYPEMFRVNACLFVRIMHAIAFRYLHALYPIVLLSVTLLFIELHARNCKPVVYMWKPLCFLCVRFRRKWEVKTSVIDAFATVILLSYSKIVNTSLYLLTRNSVISLSGGIVETRLDYDTSVVYLKEQHIYFAAVAIVMLSTFGLIPPLLLILYPNRLFFKLLTKLKLDRWHGLHMFVETFHGSFKNRTNGCPERRWFAGVYFIFRIIVFMVFALTDELTRLHLHLVFTYTAFLLLLVILRPYKNNFYTCLDASFMAVLIAINASVVYCASQVQLSGQIPRAVWRLTYAIIWIPTVYLTVYIFYLACSRSRSRFIQRYCVSNARRFKNTAIMYFANTPHQRREQLLTNDNLSTSSCDIYSDQPTHSSLEDFSVTPDRVDNPQRYYDMEWSENFRTSSTVVTVDREKDREELLSKGFQ